jgi:hypothetical protein
MNGAIKDVGENVIETIANQNAGAPDTVATRLLDGGKGQVLIANGGGGANDEPVWANITSNDNSITINESANSLDLATNLDFLDDNGNTATPNNGEITIKGGTGVTTDATGPANTITIDTDFSCNDNIETNYVICDGIRTTGATSILNNGGSEGINIATEGGRAESFNTSSGMNVALRDAIATSTNSNGFNFASQEGEATSDSGSDGFNFAAQSATATSDNFSNGFNFATLSGRATSTGSDGFNFASRFTTVSNRAGRFGSNGSMLFALGNDGSINLNNNSNNFTVAVAGSQATGANQPQEGVNFYINNSGSAGNASNLRFIDLPDANGNTPATESFLVIDNGTNEVRISSDGTNISSKRFKDDIESLDNAQVGNLNKLRPVSFTYKKDKTNRMQFGLIAEEVAEILPELVTYDNEGQVHGLKYQMLTPLLVTYIQLQQAKITELEQDNAEKSKAQDAHIAASQKKNSAQDALIAECLSRLTAIEA